MSLQPCLTRWMLSLPLLAAMSGCVAPGVNSGTVALKYPQEETVVRGQNPGDSSAYGYGAPAQNSNPQPSGYGNGYGNGSQQNDFIEAEDSPPDIVR